MPIERTIVITTKDLSFCWLLKSLVCLHTQVNDACMNQYFRFGNRFPNCISKTTIIHPASLFAYPSPLYSPHLYFLVKSLFGPSELIVILEFGVRQVVVKIEVLLGNSSSNLGQSLIVDGCKELVHQFCTLQKAVDLNFEGANLDFV